jgi:excisionase family DNA binding protein
MQSVKKPRLDHEPVAILHRPRKVAQMLDMSVSQIYNLINRGDLESIRIGRSVRVPESALRRLAGGA